MATLLGGLFLGACSVVGIRSGTEEPRYAVVTTLDAPSGAVEIRRYDARLAAETTVPGDEIAARSTGFRRLAGYIFGGNQGGTSIAMTAPVAQSDRTGSGRTIAMTAPVATARAPDGGWTIRFFLPAALKAPPRPNDASIRIVAVPPETMAVLRFSGIPGAGAVATHRHALEAALVGTAWRPTGPAVAWFYDPPWTIPPLRRNEVALPVAPAG